ncbi:hypothetical protein NQ317_007092 [Molorchus minor]|uniref:Equilibrative nucleoside transporter n=1 Tax=Molorchus minor TaxID=1323400 RepID=A0ABQ9K4M6_9CUCU|nr:hypothetical protein NQ317_007092 [Molorchus minor]
MEAYNEISDVFNRVSIASIEKSEKFQQELQKKPAPKDTFYLVRVLCLLIGLLHILPLTFFVTANNYWMYKLRDASSETVDLNNKTTLQTYFNSGLMITQSTSMILCMLLSSAFAHTIKVRSRVLSSLSIIAVLFVLFTALIKVNTDTWQTAFFVLSLATLAVICGVLTLFQVSTLALIPKFPPSYMKTFLMGQGGSGVFNGCLQIICLATGTSTETSALFYFGSGTAVIFLALFMFFITKHLAFYQYYVEDNTVQMRKERLNKEEIKYIVKNIWFCIVICLIALVNLMLVHTSITGLVVSENYGVGNRWNDVFFVPTITYLYFDVIGLIGRYVGENFFITRSNAKWWVSVTVLRVVTVPLIMLCNAKPRSHLPAYTRQRRSSIFIGVDLFWCSRGLISPLSLLGVRILKMAVDLEHRASITSDTKKQNTASEKAKEIVTEPRDKYYMVHILFLLLGLMHFLPFTFFVTANAYWMHKFRNLSADFTDVSARTPLQTHFASGTVITDTVPMLICILMSTIFGHKIKARRRVLSGLVILTICFIVGCAFVKVNTDSWQTVFFAITMIILSLISGGNSVMEIGILVNLSKFPQYYMKVYLLGQGFAGCFNSVLQLFSLVVGTSTTASALIYFGIGTLFMAMTLALFYLSKYSKLYNYHVKSNAEDTTRDLMPLSEIKSILRTIWPCVVAIGLLQLTILPTHHSITSLVVSEHHGNGSLWNDKYFVPVITFLYADIASLMGRIAASKLKKAINGFILSGIMLLRMVTFLPLIYLCNAQPRSHLPVLLPHDWQYVIVLGSLCFTTGFFINVIFLDIGKLVKPEKVEDAFMVLMSCLAVLGALFSPLSLFSVDLL